MEPYPYNVFALIYISTEKLCCIKDSAKLCVCLDEVCNGIVELITAKTDFQSWWARLQFRPKEGIYSLPYLRLRESPGSGSWAKLNKERGEFNLDGLYYPCVKERLKDFCAQDMLERLQKVDDETVYSKFAGISFFLNVVIYQRKKGYKQYVQILECAMLLTDAELCKFYLEHLVKRDNFNEEDSLIMYKFLSDQNYLYKSMAMSDVSADGLYPALKAAPPEHDKTAEWVLAGLFNRRPNTKNKLPADGLGPDDLCGWLKQQISDTYTDWGWVASINAAIENAKISSKMKYDIQQTLSKLYEAVIKDGGVLLGAGRGVCR